MDDLKSKNLTRVKNTSRHTPSSVKYNPNAVVPKLQLEGDYVVLSTTP